MQSFLKMCTELGIPIALEKTEWASTKIVFPGILLDGEELVLCIPLEKQEKALKLINELIDKKEAIWLYAELFLGISMSWFVVVCSGSWWFNVMVHGGSWWFVVVRSGSWWFVVV